MGSPDWKRTIDDNTLADWILDLTPELELENRVPGHPGQEWMAGNLFLMLPELNIMKLYLEL